MTEARKKQLQELIKDINEAEAVALYNQLGTKLNLLRKARELMSLQDYNVLDKVAFHDKGVHLEGVITRINLRTVSVIASDGRNWTVHPSYLTRIGKVTDAEDVLTPRIKPPAKQNPSSKTNKRKKKKRR